MKYLFHETPIYLKIIMGSRASPNLFSSQTLIDTTSRNNSCASGSSSNKLVIVDEIGGMDLQDIIQKASTGSLSTNSSSYFKLSNKNSNAILISNV